MSVGCSSLQCAGFSLWWPLCGKGALGCVASVVVVHRFSCPAGSSGTRIKMVSPALAGRFLITGPPGKSTFSVSMSIKQNHSTDLIGLLLFFKWVVFFCLFLFLGTNEMTYKQHLAKPGYLGRLDSKIASYCEEIPIN